MEIDQKMTLTAVQDCLYRFLLAECKRRGLTPETISRRGDGVLTPVDAKGLIEGWRRQWSLRQLYGIAVALDMEIQEVLSAANVTIYKVPVQKE